MTNSQVKRAIDESIGKEPLMNEAFLQKVVQNKKRKKPLPFLQPAIVVLLMLVIGTVLYFTPEQRIHAVEIESQYLKPNQEQLVAEFYGAIVKQDKRTLAKISDVSSEQVFARYSIFEFTKPVEVIKTIESDETITVFLKLQSNNTDFLDELIIHKETEKIEVDTAQIMGLYDANAELPKNFVLEYKVAPYAPIMKNIELDLKKADIQKVNDYTLYQIPTDEGTWRVFEAPDGKQFDLNTVSSGQTEVITGNNGKFFFIDSETMETTYIHRDKEGNYQIVTGQLKYPGVTTYQTDFHEEPVFMFGGREPKVITTKKGQLMYAEVFGNVNLINSPAFYDTEGIGQHILVKYSEDSKQISTYYQFTSQDELMDYRKIGMLEAKPEHFIDMSLVNRYNDQLIYIFKKGTIYYRGKSNSGELIEEEYTNIQLDTKDNQYFITGDNGFSWTLTRTAPRILQDEKGIEYTAPVAFEDLSKVNTTLLDEDIQSLRVYKINGYGTNAYIFEEDLDEVNELLAQADVNKDFITLEKPELMIEIEYSNGKKENLELWLNEGKTSIVMKSDLLNNRDTLYTIPDALANHFRLLVENIEEIDNSK